MNDTYRAISLGWGVQSWTLAAMAALGELPPVDVAIHADTGHEMAATYEFAATWAPWLEERDLRVVTVTNDNKMGTKTLIPNGDKTFLPMPVFVDTDGKRGISPRQCTKEWKILPMARWLCREAGAKAHIEQWLGISTDEWHRAKDSRIKSITNRYPLLELGMNRADCLAWLAAHELPSPGKSSCTFCPFHNLAAWRKMKKEGGADWEEAVAVDAQIRDARPPRRFYIHASFKPLNEAVIIPEDFGYTQLELLESDDKDAECDSGACFL